MRNHVLHETVENKKLKSSKRFYIHETRDMKRNGAVCTDCITPSAAKLGTELLDVEMWCWGRDIASKSGNHLLEYGFTRERPPGDLQGSSRYSLHLEDGTRIVLWGWGVLYSNSPSNGVFLRRYKFNPRLTTSNDEAAARWAPGEIPGLRPPSNPGECRGLQKQLRALLTWISVYESWIREKRGEDYRKGCIEARNKPTRIRAEELPSLWGNLAKICAKGHCRKGG